MQRSAFHAPEQRLPHVASHAGGWPGGYGAAPHVDSLKPPVLLLGDQDGELRLRINGLAICQAVLLPCALCTGTLLLLSFPFGVEHKALSAFLIILGVLAVAAFVGKATHSIMAGAKSGKKEPTWYFFLAVTCLVAWLVGFIAGKCNFASRMDPYYKMAIMGTATGIDPADIPATKYMDVSRAVFQEGTHIAEDLSLGYKDSDVYCVAPIVSNSTMKPATYDFWAVGINCCSPIPPARFWCGTTETDDPLAHGGVRWMERSTQPYFKLAIEQAEAEYGYKSGKPLFFTWTKDPIADVESLHSAGVSFTITVAIVHLIMQAILVSCVVLAFTSSGPVMSAVRRLVAKDSTTAAYGTGALDAHPGQGGSVTGMPFTGVGTRLGGECGAY
mmetsp:Transcript_56293/g.163250  ORF Transcript_56293/g.163250 Transcript_56293/m.163250 type:complete len:387 (-) Transcript_56293:223-1383(-)